MSKYTLLTDILTENAQSSPHKSALTMHMGYRTVTLTYAQVYELAKKIAVILEQNNIGHGDPVIVIAPNSPYWICLFWACLLRGAIIVPLNTQSTSLMITHVLNQTNARIVFCDVFSKNKITPPLKPYILDYIEDLVRDIDATQYKPLVSTPNDVVQILYTSGTTGDPKGVMHTHTNLLVNLEAILAIYPNTHVNDRFLSILPLSHIFEQMAGFLVPFARHAHIIYTHSPTAIMQLLKEFHITKLIAVPEFLHIVMGRIRAQALAQNKSESFERALHWSKKINTPWISRLIFRRIHTLLGGSLDTVISGGAPLSADLENDWLALGISVMQGYGLTETSPLVTTNRPDHNKPGSVGTPIEYVQVRLAPDKEIQVKGPNVFKGYFKNEAATAQAFTPDGWFKTGDLGFFDEDGFLFIRGRKKYMILSPGGQNVFPEDIEDVLNSMPGVQTSCVVGLATSEALTDIHAALILQPSIKNPEETAQRIINKANERLATYQRITGWSLWPQDDFPRTVTKKIKKNDVIAHLQSTLVNHDHTSTQPTHTLSPIVTILSQITDIPAHTIQPTATLVGDLKLDSLMRVELVARIEQTCRVDINEGDITPSTTVCDLERIVKEQKPLPKKPQLSQWPRSWWARLIRAFTQPIIFLLTRTFVKLTVTGRENLKGLKGPLIFMPNHTSYLDSVVVTMALPWRIRMNTTFAAARDVLFEQFKMVAWLGELIFNAFPLQRGQSTNIKLGFEYMGKLIDQGYSVTVFPEGMLSKTGQLLPLKPGVGVMALEMGCTIVPMKVTGTADIVPYGKAYPVKRGAVTVTFGKPIRFDRNKTNPAHAIAVIQKAMQEL